MERLKVHLIVLLFTFFSTSFIKGETFISWGLKKRPVGDEAREKCAEYSKFGKTDKNECYENYFKYDKDWDYIAKPGEFPHMVILGKSEDDYSCIGNLISEKFVLSVAHCPKNIMNRKNGTGAIWARIGDNDREHSNNSTAVTIKVAKSHIHPNFTFQPIANDISVLELEEKVKFDQLKRPACLNTEREVNKATFVSGWGIRSNIEDEMSTKLLKTEMKITKEIDDVTKAIGSDNPMFLGVKHLPGMKDSCLGDSGAPLMTTMENPNCMYNIVGLNTHGKSCAKFASFYTRVSNYVEWIENIVWPDDEWTYV